MLPAELTPPTRVALESALRGNIATFATFVSPPPPGTAMSLPGPVGMQLRPAIIVSGTAPSGD
jgi:hypothetical protein